MVLTLAPEEQFIFSGNGSAINGSWEATEEVDFNAMEAQRILIASTMTVLIGLFQVGFYLCYFLVIKEMSK